MFHSLYSGESLSSHYNRLTDYTSLPVNGVRGITSCNLRKHYYMFLPVYVPIFTSLSTILMPQSPSGPDEGQFAYLFDLHAVTSCLFCMCVGFCVFLIFFL